MVASAIRSRNGSGRAGLALLTAGLGLGAGLILLAHPLFALGVWQDGQPMGIGLQAAAGLCLLGLAIRAPHSRLVRGALVHPLALAPAALAAWSLIALPLAERPWRSLFGPAETGQGALWYLAMAALAAAALAIRPARRLWTGVVLVAAASSTIAAILGIGGLTWLYPTLVDWNLVPPVRLLQFNEYLAYAGLALLTLALGRDGQRKAALALGALGVLVLLVSRNRTAFLVMPLLFPLLALVRSRLAGSGRTVAVIAAAAAVVTVAPVVVELLLGRDHPAALQSLWSRGVILHALLPTLADSPRALLAGHGWGAAAEGLLRHLTQSGVSVHALDQWGGLQRDLFHSHNAAAEAQLATGLPGALLAVLLPAAAAAGSRSRRIWLAAAFALSWAALDAFWFMIPAGVPLVVLAGASLASRPGGRRAPNRLRPAMAPGLVVLGVGCLAAAGALGWQAAEETRLAGSLRLDSTAAAVPVAPPLDLRRDGRALANLLSTAVQEGLAAGAGLSPPRAGRIGELQRQAARLAEHGHTPILALAVVNALAAEAYAPPASPLAWQDQDALAAAWDLAVRRLLRDAPERLDIAAPLLNWLLANSRDGQLMALLDHARRIDRRHPVVQWFDGVLLLAAAEPERRAWGLESMRQALRQGLERYMPVGQAVKDGLAQGAPAQELR